MFERKKSIWRSLQLIAVEIAINLLGVFLAKTFGWLLFLDSIGTILAAAVGGLLPGILVGFLSNAINSISDPITLYYGLLSVLIAITAAKMAERGVFGRLGPALLTIPAFAFIGGVLGSAMTWLLYGFDFGSGISAPLAIALNNSGGFRNSGRSSSPTLASISLTRPSRCSSSISLCAFCRAPR